MSIPVSISHINYNLHTNYLLSIVIIIVFPGSRLPETREIFLFNTDIYIPGFFPYLFQIYILFVFTFIEHVL